MQVCEGGLQQLGEARSPRLSRGSLFPLEVWGLLVLQLQLRQLQHQGLRPHRPLSWRSALGERPQVGYGEAKDKDGVGGDKGEGGAKLNVLDLRGKKGRKNLSVTAEDRFKHTPHYVQHTKLVPY